MVVPWILALILMVGLTACGTTGGGGDDNTKRGGADSVSGPTITVNCQTTTSSPDRNIGDTTVNVTCPADNSVTTPPPSPLPKSP